MNRIALKGGSLSATYLIEDENSSFVRKYVDTKQNREYGFVRWYSQLKKLQRLNHVHPTLFPKVLNVSYSNGNAYFDIEYYRGFSDIKTILTESNLTPTEIEHMVCAMISALDQVHSKTYDYNSGALYLYFIEELLQKLEDAKKFKEFLDFSLQSTFNYQECTVNNLQIYLKDVEDCFGSSVLVCEQDTHGNPTLENTLYSLNEKRIVFVDPYEESIVDTALLDYSMVLQCSRSHYSYLNPLPVTIFRNTVTHNHAIPTNLSLFNKYFEEMISNRINNITLLNLFEASQFIRMLPFKCAAGDIEKAKFFFVHACSLIEKTFKHEKSFH